MGNVKTPYDRVFIKTDEEITLPEKQALIGRLEKFLYAICTFDFDDLPIPQSRIEKFVFALISGEIPDIVPQSRAEKFLLAYLTGDTSDLPEPQSRIELLLNNLATFAFLNIYTKGLNTDYSYKQIFIDELQDYDNTTLMLLKSIYLR